jgi:hypothetical protein
MAQKKRPPKAALSTLKNPIILVGFVFCRSVQPMMDEVGP